LNFVPLYIAAIAVLMLAGAVWRFRQRDMVGMLADGWPWRLPAAAVGALAGARRMISPTALRPHLNLIAQNGGGAGVRLRKA
jgi:hypothetical protein